MPIAMAKMASLALLLLAVCFASTANAQSGTAVANLYDYNQAASTWDLNADSCFCSTWYAGEPLSWRKQYNWAAFCEPAGPTGYDACGKCMSLTNTRTGASTTVRIMDQCTKVGMDVDKTAFTELDSDGNGFMSGSISVYYEFFSC